MERDGYMAGVPCWIDTTQPDPEAAAAFYGELFGWELEDTMPARSSVRYFIARLHGGDVAAISSRPEGGPPGATWNTYVWTESADATASAVRDAGGRVLAEPFDVMDAGRMAVLADPAGAMFSAWQANRHQGARVVNEPGSLNFNDLVTDDVDGAKAFYGAIFGWETLAMGGDAAMWTLPGYGDFLARNDPELRERMAQVGAPPGFEDVVATLRPIAPGEPGAAAHWGVTFAVDDADAVARRAGELGGRVLVAPVDAPWVRMTVIADPQGAVFTASAFVVENRDVPAPSA